MMRTLAKDYGRSSEYTEGQVKTALKKLGYSVKFEKISIGVFCSEGAATVYGLDEAIIKKYRGYPKALNVDFNVGAGVGSTSETFE